MIPDADLNNHTRKTILITGATAGFGLGLVKTLLQRGHKVIATGRNLTQRTDLFAIERTQFLQQLMERDFDVTRAEERAQLVSELTQLGGFDVLINNAGYGLFGPLECTSEKDLRGVFEVNFFAPTLLIRDCLPLLRQSKGLVINVSSVLGFMGFPLASLYCASKFALEGLTESLAFELAPHGVRYVLVQPGGYKTSFHSRTQWSTEEEQCPAAYRDALQNYKRLREQQNKSPHAQDPQEVIEGIVKSIESNRKTFRLTYGRDANLTQWLRSFLPRQIFHRLAKLAFNRTIGKLAGNQQRI